MIPEASLLPRPPSLLSALRDVARPENMPLTVPKGVVIVEFIKCIGEATAAIFECMVRTGFALFL